MPLTASGQLSSGCEADGEAFRCPAKRHVVAQAAGQPQSQPFAGRVAVDRGVAGERVVDASAVVGDSA